MAKTMAGTFTTALYPARLILDDVPRVGFDLHLSPFPGSLYVVLSYLGDPHDYDYLMGITGAAFRRLWHRDDGGNIDLSRFGDTPFCLAFNALGYAWHTVKAEKEAMRLAIKECLARGVPPISFGILGPPEAGLVTGYEQDGAVIYGWSYFQPDGSRYYEKSDWFETMDMNAGKGLIVIDDKKTLTPPEDKMLVTSLEWAVDLACTSSRPSIPDHASGLAAYYAWASALEVDADYPPENPEVMATRTMIHGDQCIMLDERREAARFLRRMKNCAPRAADCLEHAAVHYDEVANLCTKVWPWPVDTNDVAMQALADGRTRRELAGYIRMAREGETRAVAYLKQTLAAMAK